MRTRNHLLLYFVLIVSSLPICVSADQSVIDVIDSFQIAGIGLKSTAEEVDAAISRQKIPMKCDVKRTPRTKHRAITTPSSTVWKCAFQGTDNAGRRWKRLSVYEVEGNIKRITYEGSMLTSLDPDDMVSHIRNTYRKLPAPTAAGKTVKYEEGDIKGASSEVFRQSLEVVGKELCKNRPVTVSLVARITEIPSQDAITFGFGLRRDERNACHRPVRNY